MSGIAGLVRLDRAPLDSHCLDRALAVLARRGPDRQRSVVGDNAAFGQTLLATAPEALVEVQPWTHPDSGCTIVADSRLDNRPELLQQLGLRDRHVDSIGDAELLHAAWQRWGEACAIRLFGDFAFAIWNPRTQSLFCARDPMGVRPLLYCHLPGRLFAFATEADALLRMAGVPHTLNEGRIADVILDLEGIDHASTMFESIAQLPGAHVLCVDQATQRTTRYWTPTDDLVETQYSRDEDYAEAMRAQLEQAVHCRLRSNDLVGSMLSGGLDSSAIAALASREMLRARGASLPTFSTVDRSQPCPETRAVDAMLAQSGFLSHPFDVADNGAGWAPLAAEQERLLEPFDWGMGLLRAHYLVANRAGVRAMLDGIDADGLFNEGTFQARLMRRGKWITVWREARGQTRFHNGLYSTWSWLRSDLAQLIVPQALLSARTKLKAPRRMRSRVTDALISSDLAVRVSASDRILQCAASRAYPPSADRHAEGVFDIISPTLARAIDRYDRVASAHACEPRHPFMDRRLMGFALGLPDEQRQRDGWPKWIVRRAMKGILPDAVIWRRGKQHLGWMVSQRMLQQRGAERIRQLVNDRETLGPYIDMRGLAGQVDLWLREGNTGAAERIHAILALHDWLCRQREQRAPGSDASAAI